jgi:hypothetical protein
MLARSKLECASVVWNSITSTDANKLERIRKRFAVLCFNRFVSQVQYRYSLALEQLRLLTLRVRRHYQVAPFLIQVFLGSKFCPSVLETWSSTSCSVHQRLCFVQCLLLKYKIAPLLDALQLLMLLAWMLTYLGPKRFFLIIFHSSSIFILNYSLYTMRMYEYVAYIFSRRIMAGAFEILNVELALGLLCKHVNKYRIDN